MIATLVHNVNACGFSTNLATGHVTFLSGLGGRQYVAAATWPLASSSAKSESGHFLSGLSVLLLNVLQQTD